MVEYSFKQHNCKRNRICGDTCQFVKLDDKGSFKALLCDGMGHGLKANILANITMPMVLNHDFEHDSIEHLTQAILDRKSVV